MHTNLTILGIESSCDETAAAVYDSSKGLVSNVLFSQTELHKQYGGVVPEIASRYQLEKINTVIKDALLKASLSLADIDAVAVTNRPGLPGSLLVGVSFAKGLAYAAKTRIIGINHLEGHVFSVMIEHKVPFPYLCLTASGGHTSLYLVKDYGDFTLLSETSDDAAGEAFDKVAKMLSYPYPGGPIIERLAQEVNFEDSLHYPRLKKNDLSLSFSGLKTAVLYSLVKREAYDMNAKEFLQPDNIDLKRAVASSLLNCISDIFVDRVIRALKKYECKALAFVGGVACNKFIKKNLQQVADKYQIPFYWPSPRFCTDNAAMIALVGYYKAQQGKFSTMTLDIY